MCLTTKGSPVAILAQVSKLSTMSFKDVDRLVTVFIPLCPQQCCLPYLDKGGLRQDLVVKCKAWIVGLLELDSQLRFAWVTAVREAFVKVDEHNRKKLEVWDVEAAKAKSWAAKMTTKLQ